MFGFLPVSATSQINAVQMLVSLSRASQEVRLYTDSTEVLKEVAISQAKAVRSRAHLTAVAMPRNGYYSHRVTTERNGGHNKKTASPIALRLAVCLD